jgi:hypothetical protein
LLTIDLAREIPDALKPRRIVIGQATANGESEKPRAEQPRQAA